MPYQQESKYKLSYFTGVQASIWIGDIWIEEVFGVSFSASQNIVPIFGYASSIYDAVARGKAIVQGTFEVNFVNEGYLYYILHKHNADKLDGQSETRNVSRFLLTGEAPPTSEVSKRIQELASTAAGLADNESHGVALAEIMDFLATTDAAGAKRLSRELDQARNLEQQKSLRNNKESVIYDMIAFDLQGIFGNPELTREVTEKRIRNCFLVSNEMIFAQDDEPIKERYSFIGQIHK